MSPSLEKVLIYPGHELSVKVKIFSSQPAREPLNSLPHKEAQSLTPKSLQGSQDFQSLGQYRKGNPVPALGKPHRPHCQRYAKYGTSLVVQWLMLRANNAGSKGFDPCWGN